MRRRQRHVYREPLRPLMTLAGEVIVERLEKNLVEKATEEHVTRQVAQLHLPVSLKNFLIELKREKDVVITTGCQVM